MTVENSCKHSGGKGHELSKSCAHLVTAGKTPVVVNSAQFWVNRRDNYMAAARIKDVKILTIKEERDKLVKLAFEAGKKAKAIKEGAIQNQDSADAELARLEVDAT